MVSQLISVMQKLVDVNYKNIDGVKSVKEVLLQRMDECRKPEVKK